VLAGISATADFDYTRGHELRAAPHDLDALLLEVGAIELVQLADVRAAGRGEQRMIERRTAFDQDAVLAEVLAAFSQLGRVPLNFFGDTTLVDTRSAERAAFDQRDASAKKPRTPCRRDAAAATADDEIIVSVHVWGSSASS